MLSSLGCETPTRPVAILVGVEVNVVSEITMGAMVEHALDTGTAADVVVAGRGIVTVLALAVTPLVLAVAAGSNAVVAWPAVVDSGRVIAVGGAAEDTVAGVNKVSEIMEVAISATTVFTAVSEDFEVSIKSEILPFCSTSGPLSIMWS